MIDSEDFKKIFQDMMVRSFNKLKNDKVANSQKLSKSMEEILQTSALLIANCYTPMVYKLTKLKDERPDFEPTRILLSTEAFNRLRILWKLKLVPKGRYVMGVPYVVSPRIKSEVYCRYE